MESNTNNIKFDTFAVILSECTYKDWYIYIDSKEMPGFFYIYYKQYLLDYLGDGYDSWCESVEVLENYFRGEDGLKVKWLNDVEISALKKREFDLVKKGVVIPKFLDKFKKEYGL